MTRKKFPLPISVTCTIMWNLVFLNQSEVHVKLFLMQCVFLAVSSPKLNPLPHFCKHYNFLWESFTSLSSTPGEIDICTRKLFCTKFNFEQLKAFFDAMRIFGCVKPQTESTFPFWILVITRTSAHLRERLRCCLFTFMAWYVSIIIGGYAVPINNKRIIDKPILSSF